MEDNPKPEGPLTYIQLLKGLEGVVRVFCVDREGLPITETGFLDTQNMSGITPFAGHICSVFEKIEAIGREFGDTGEIEFFYTELQKYGILAYSLEGAAIVGIVTDQKKKLSDIARASESLVAELSAELAKMIRVDSLKVSLRQPTQEELDEIL